jgi:hypothetical protein
MVRQTAAIRRSDDLFGRFLPVARSGYSIYAATRPRVKTADSDFSARTSAARAKHARNYFEPATFGGRAGLKQFVSKFETGPTALFRQRPRNPLKRSEKRRWFPRARRRVFQKLNHFNESPSPCLTIF